MSEAGIDNEIAILQYRQREKVKKGIQDEELAKLPKLIHVTYTGDINQFMHNGRSKSAKKNPFRFQKDKYIAMNQPEDIKYFLNQNAGYFVVEIMDNVKLVEKETKKAIATVESLEAELNALKKLEAEKKVKAKAKARPKSVVKAKSATKSKSGGN